MENSDFKYTTDARLKRRQWIPIVLGVCLCGLLGLRLVGIGGRGLLEHDEGHAMLNAFTYRNILEWIFSGGFLDKQAGLDHIRDTLHKGGGTLYSAGKSGYSILLALLSFLSGPMTAKAALVWAWVAGCITVISAGAVAYYFSGRKIAAFWLCAFGVALSPNLLYSSREVSGVIWSLAFGFLGLAVMCGADVWRGGRLKNTLLYLGGLLLGYGFTCHFNLAPFIVAAMAAYGAWLYVRDEDGLISININEIIKRQVIVALGGLTVAAVFQIVTGLAAWKLAKVYPDYRSFFGELSFLLVKDQGQKRAGVLYGDGVLGYGREAWLFYGKALWRECFLWLLLFVVSIIGILRCGNKWKRFLPVLILFLLPTLFWAGAVYKVERVLGMCIAASWIVIAVEGVRREKQWLFVPVLLLLFTYHGWEWRKLLIVENPVPEISYESLVYARKNGKLITAGSFDLSYAPLWKWYLIESRRRVVGSDAAIDFSRKSGETMVFIDPGTWKYPDKKEFGYSREEVESWAKIDLLTSDYITNRKFFVYENAVENTGK